MTGHVAIQASSDGIDLASMAVGVAGGLALFLYGMGQMTDALKTIAGDRMREVMGRLTTNRFAAAGAGAFVTAVIQSSSVTTVLVVGFISAGLMTLQQSVGVILGANIGTTVTAQIVAFKVTDFAMVLIAAGFGATMLFKQSVWRRYGLMIMGLGLVFFGMDLMSQATSPLRTSSVFLEWMQRMQNPVLGITAGAVFTAIVQSSSATTGIIIVLASQGFITLPAGIALALGANIGTCATALVASIGRTREAQQAAMVHVMFNVGGALLWVFFVDELAALVRSISPAHKDLAGVERLAAETPRQIANAHTAFNILNTFIFIWFAGPMARIAKRIIPDRPVQLGEHVRPKYLDPVYLQTPAMALGRVQLELCRLGKLVGQMLDEAPHAVLAGSERELDRVKLHDDDVDALYDAIILYLAKISQSEMSESQSKEIAAYSAVANHLESIGDNIETNLVTLGRDRLHQHVTVSKPTQEHIEALHASVREAFAMCMEALRSSDAGLAKRIIDMKPKIRALSDRATEHLRQRLAAKDPNRIATFRVETDLIEHMQRQFYFVRRMAKAMHGLWNAEEQASGD